MFEYSSLTKVLIFNKEVTDLKNILDSLTFSSSSVTLLDAETYYVIKSVSENQWEKYKSISNSYITLENCQKDTCTLNAVLKKGKFLQSKNGKYKLTLHTDGNLELSSGTAIIWSTGTKNVDVKLYFQEETGGEELRLYGKNQKVVWKTKGRGKATKLILQDDGNLVMYNTCDRPTWDTGTYEGWSFLILF